MGTKFRIARQWVGTLAVIALLGLAATAWAGGFARWAAIEPAISQVPQEAGPVDPNGNPDEIVIVDFGRVVYVGPMDVTATLDRIRSNQSLPHNNDGAVFANRQRLLPVQPSGYYHEFVHWPYDLQERPYGIQFPGPMRVILGAGGEVYFTGNHYASFYYVN